MDKVEAVDKKDRLQAVDEILRVLKNLFTTSGLTFIFVGGQDLHERWRDDLGRGDSVYESVFAYNQYLPAMWDDVGRLCGNWVSEWEVGANRDVYDQFVRFLTFQGRGLPREHFARLQSTRPLGRAFAISRLLAPRAAPREVLRGAAGRAR